MSTAVNAPSLQAALDDLLGHLAQRMGRVPICEGCACHTIGTRR